jgi:hypothetical protein
MKSLKIDFSLLTAKVKAVYLPILYITLISVKFHITKMK